MKPCESRHGSPARPTSNYLACAAVISSRRCALLSLSSFAGSPRSACAVRTDRVCAESFQAGNRACDRVECATRPTTLRSRRPRALSALRVGRRPWSTSRRCPRMLAADEKAFPVCFRSVISSSHLWGEQLASLFCCVSRVSPRSSPSSRWRLRCGRPMPRTLRMNRSVLICTSISSVELLETANRTTTRIWMIFRTCTKRLVRVP